VLSYELQALRMLADRREELTRQRFQTVNRLQRLLSEFQLGKPKKDITALQAEAILASVRPRIWPGRPVAGLRSSRLTEVVAVEMKIKALTEELKARVMARGFTPTDLSGVGPVMAARTPRRCRCRGAVRPTGTGSHPGPAPRPWTPPPESRSGTGCHGGGPEDEPHAAHRRGHPGAARHRWRRYYSQRARPGWRRCGA
jgi:HAMP domain-containing protein